MFVSRAIVCVWVCVMIVGSLESSAGMKEGAGGKGCSLRRPRPKSASAPSTAMPPWSTFIGSGGLYPFLKCSLTQTQHPKHAYKLTNTRTHRHRPPTRAHTHTVPASDATERGAHEERSTLMPGRQTLGVACGQGKANGGWANTVASIGLPSTCSFTTRPACMRKDARRSQALAPKAKASPNTALPTKMLATSLCTSPSLLCLFSRYFFLLARHGRDARAQTLVPNAQTLRCREM